MRKTFLISLLSIFAFNAPAFAGPEHLNCVPATSRSFPITGLVSSGLSERDYNDVLNLIEDHYREEIALYGADLNVVRAWRSSDPNAYADRPWYNPSEWQIVMAGGLARHPDMTKDGFTLVACHELGHHIGGAPKHRRFSTWASTEGQSDYFATLKCLRRVFKSDDNVELAKNMAIPEVLRNVCEAQYANENEAAICVRSIYAGMSVSKVFADLADRQGITNTAAFNSVNTSIVSSSYNYHPRTQCRFDTFRAGAFCPISPTERVSQRDPLVSTCNESQGYHKLTARPACWYHAD